MTAASCIDRAASKGGGESVPLSHEAETALSSTLAETLFSLMVSSTLWGFVMMVLVPEQLYRHHGLERDHQN
jgi:hypothetical protein